MLEERKLFGASYVGVLEAPQIYRERRKKLAQTIGSRGVAVLLGGSDIRSYGDVGTFRQEPNFFYLTGVELPNAVLLVSQEQDVLYLPPRKPSLEAWTGPRYGPGEETAAALGFGEAKNLLPSEVVVEARLRPLPGFEDELASNLASGKELWLPLPPPKASGPLSREQELACRLRERLPSFLLHDLTPILTQMRLRKEEGELALLREAVRITAEGLKAVAAALKPGVREATLEGLAFATFRREGAEGWAFPPIVASGEAGCILHYDQNAGICREGELVVVDIGARYGYYCGDLSRTLPVSGSFSPRQAELYDAVLEAYQAALRELRPGSSLAAMRHAAFEALARTGLKGEEGRPLSEFFIHGIGHFLGLETHDVGTDNEIFEPGMVVTLEPGIYLPQEGIGIRIEDDYLLTREGSLCLTPAWLPRQREDVEKLVGGKHTT